MLTNKTRQSSNTIALRIGKIVADEALRDALVAFEYTAERNPPK